MSHSLQGNVRRRTQTTTLLAGMRLVHMSTHTSTHMPTRMAIHKDCDRYSHGKAGPMSDNERLHTGLHAGLHACPARMSIALLSDTHFRRRVVRAIEQLSVVASIQIISLCTRPRAHPHSPSRARVRASSKSCACMRERTGVLRTSSWLAFDELAVICDASEH